MTRRCSVLVTCVFVASVITTVASGSAGLAAAQPPDADDPTLAQTIAPDQPLASGAVELSTGHIDLAPSFVAGTWKLMIHDPSAESSVWRQLTDVVLRIGDGGRAVVPDDDRYSFLGGPPGTPVWVMPQTENPSVVWLGWNTQDPAVMERIDRGVRLRLVGVDGPGKLSVYLQSGALSGPQVLWESDAEATEPLWVDVNTHTHANWVFSEPGVYLVRMEAEATLLDGTTVSDTGDVRFAVGDGTAFDEALGARFAGRELPVAEEPEGTGEAAHSVAAASAGRNDDAARVDGVPILVGAVAGVVCLVVGIGAWRSSRERRRALQNRMRT